MDLDKRELKRGPGRPSNASKANGAHASANGQHPKRRRGRGVFATPGHEFLLDRFTGGKTLNIGQMRDAFDADGRSPASVNSVLQKLINEGALKRSGAGEYKATGKAPKAAATAGKKKSK